MKRIVSAVAGLLLAALPAVAPAFAYKWPGERASPGGAVSARVIGEQCAGVLSSAEIAELDAFIDRAGGELTAKHAQENGGDTPFQFEAFTSSLRDTYVADFKTPGRCNDGTAEEARDMLNRVRLAMASSDPLYPPESHPKWRPDISDAMAAKLIGQRCEGALTAREIAELQLYMADIWMRWVTTSSDADARTTMQLYDKVGADMEKDWNANSCRADAVARARKIATIAHQSAK
jgi:hypothetical protein